MCISLKVGMRGLLSLIYSQVSCLHVSGYTLTVFPPPGTQTGYGAQEKLSAEDCAHYCKQLEIMRTICREFERERETKERHARFDQVLQPMQQVCKDVEWMDHKQPNTPSICESVGIISSVYVPYDTILVDAIG